MKIFIRFFLVFLIITGAVTLLGDFSKIEFGRDNFWNNHGIFFLVFITLFPRLTLLFSSVATGGIFWWLSWFFVPRFLVAVLATLSYWHQNPALVVAAWLVALSGESSEKTALIRRPRMRVYTTGFRARSQNQGAHRATQARESSLNDPNTFDAEFKEEKD